jgi:hypothetical protein
MTEIVKKGRLWHLLEDGQLLAVCAYKKGAESVKEKLDEYEMYTSSLEEQIARLKSPRVNEPAQLDLFGSEEICPAGP